MFFYNIPPKIPLPLCELSAGHVRGAVSVGRSAFGCGATTENPDCNWNYIYVRVLSLSSLQCGAGPGDSDSDMESHTHSAGGWMDGARCHYLPIHNIVGDSSERYILTEQQSKRTTATTTTTTVVQPSNGRVSVIRVDPTVPSPHCEGDGCGARTVTNVL